MDQSFRELHLERGSYACVVLCSFGGGLFSRYGLLTPEKPVSQAGQVLLLTPCVDKEFSTQVHGGGNQNQMPSLFFFF